MKNATATIKFFSIARRKCGKIFTYWAGSFPFVVILDPVAAKQIFLGDINTFVKGPDYTEKIKVAFGDGLVTSVGIKHRSDRSLMQRIFSRSSVERYRSYMREKVLEMMNNILLPNDGKEVDVTEFFSHLSLNVFSQFALSHEYDSETVACVSKFVSDGSKLIGKRIMFGLPMHSIFPEVRKIKEYVRLGKSLLTDVVEKRIKARNQGEDEPEDCLKLLLDADLPREEILDHLCTLMSAGHDTTALFASFMAFLLAKHPEVQQKIKAELKNVVGDRLNISAQDFGKLKYLSYVMKETLRMYGIIPAVPRVCMKDTQLKQCNGTFLLIPKGTTCLISIATLNRDGDIWEDPNKFIPERFENVSTFSSSKHGFFPFGHGRRECIGNILAQVEVGLMFAVILQKITFEAVPNFAPELVAGISMVSDNGVRVRVLVDKTETFDKK